MAGDDDQVKPMSDDEFEFYRKNGRLPTPQETATQLRTKAATETQKQTAATEEGLPWYERQAQKLSRAAEAAHTEDLRRAARGEAPQTLGAKSNLLDLAARATHTLGGVTTPKGLAMLGGAVVAPEVVGPYMMYEGGRGTLEGISRMRREGMTPENVGETLGSASEAVGGAATTGIRGGGRVGRAAREPLPGTSAYWWQQRFQPRQGPELPPGGAGGGGAAMGQPLPRIPGPAGGGGAAGPPPRGVPARGPAPGPAGGPGTVGPPPTGRPPGPLPKPPRAPRPGPVQGPKLPTAEESLNVPAQQMFGKNYADLLPDQKRAAASRLGGPVGEQQTTLPTIAPEAAERRVADVGPPAGGIDQRAVNRDIVTLKGTNPDKAYLLSNTLEEWKKATGAEKDVLADRIRGMQEEMQPHPDIAGRGPEPSIFKPGETVTSMKPEVRMSREEAEAASAKRTAGRQARFEGTPTTPPLPTGPIVTPAPTPAAPATPGEGMPTVTPARGTVPAAPAPTPLTPLPGANVPQGTIPPIDLNEILRQATGQPEAPKPKPGVPLGEQLGKE